jgi:transcriptional regulator with XRE-family HTH domain
VSAPGDLGRRVAERRRDLGLGTAELAGRAGMSEAYLEALERDPTLRISPSALLRLAAALDVTVDQLQGAGAGRPPAAGAPVSRPVLDAIGAEECAGLLDPGGVGRFVFVGPDGPTAVPVNYRMVDGDVVFRTEEGSLLAGPHPGPVAIEVDQVDDALREGWSVLATGRSRLVTDPDELEGLAEVPVRPWAAGAKAAYVRLRPDRLTGRRIRSRPDRG